MCGIAGWIGPEYEDAVLKDMTGAIAHRGPDGDGHITLPAAAGGVAALGHRRLSIIDLAGGGQPMQSHDDRFTVVFNGEIYNYIELRDELLSLGATFRTNSDTEVILEAWRAWGPDCLTRFRGMFAFAIHDATTRAVSLARDPFGKKPLFYYRTQTPDGPLLVFCSESAGLMRHPAVEVRLNDTALWNYLTWRYVPGPETFFEGIRKLPPASVMTVGAGEPETRRYWIPPEEKGPQAPPPEDAIEAFLDVFDESVRLRLRSDVPLGAFLSSGLDSSSIVASLAHLGASEIRTFSVGYKGDPGSELKAAAETAAAIGTIHTPLEFDADDLHRLLPLLSRHLGAPLAETACLPIYMMSMEAAKSVKVILSGEGADEIFAGYPKHRVEARLGGLPSPLIAATGYALLAGTAVAPARLRRQRIAARALRAGRFDDRMIAWFGAFSPSERDRLWLGAPATPQLCRVPFEAAPDASALRRVLHFDQTSWLPDNLLERIDMMTMAASLEARAPFMDIRLAEFAATLPDTWRIQGNTTKRVLRKALAPRLPEAVVKRSKIGFRLPVGSWFRGPLRDPFRDLVLSEDAVLGRYLDQSHLAKMSEDHAAGRINHDKSLWAIYALEIFLREFF